MPQYVRLDWFVTKEDFEALTAYAEQRGFIKPCDLVQHLVQSVIPPNQPSGGPDGRADAR